MAHIGTRTGRAVKWKETEEALRASQTMLEGLFEAAPDAILLVNEAGRIVRLNRQAELMFGYDREELLGRPVEVLMPARFRAGHTQLRSAYYAEPRSRPMETGLQLYGRRGDGSEFPATVMLSPLQTEGGVFVISVVRDVTERLQAEEALRRQEEFEEALQGSEARFRAFFEKAAIGIALLDLEGGVVDSNPAWQRMLGYSGEELRGMSFGEYTHPADLKANMRLFQELAAGTRDHYRLEKRYLRKDGQMVWGNLTVSLVRDAEGKPQFMIGMVMDITERKQMEAELAEVQRRLMEGREAERLHLAQELHDGPLQDLHGIAYRLADLTDGLSDEADLGQMVAARATLQRVLRMLRTISGELRPPALAPFGLEKAIRSHAEEFQRQHPELKIEFELMPDGQALPEQVRLALFRIYQQALNNVVRHAQASLVSIRFDLEDRHMVLEIQDDGRGFEVPKRRIELVRRGHLGLVGIAERAEAIGGRLEVVSAPRQGTLIRVALPRLDGKETGDMPGLWTA